MNQGKNERALLPADLASLSINLFFAAASFANSGKCCMKVFGAAIDREAFMGVLFLAFVPAQLALIHFTNPTARPAARFVRYFHAQAFMPFWFGESILLSQLFSGGASFDRLLADWDRLIFGFQPAMEFHRALPGPVWTEIFFFGYFAYYFLITTGWWALFFRGKYEEAARCLFIVTASFGLLFVWYAFFPVQGPKYFFPELKAAWYGNFKGYLFTSIMKRVFHSMNLGGAAFPSSHVAISLISLFLNARHNRKLLPIIAPLTILLFFSTVYIYAHYAVDVFAGMAAGPLLLLIFSLAYRPASKTSQAMSAFAIKRIGFNPMAPEHEGS